MSKLPPIGATPISTKIGHASKISVSAAAVLSATSLRVRLVIVMAMSVTPKNRIGPGRLLRQRLAPLSVQLPGHVLQSTLPQAAKGAVLT